MDRIESFPRSRLATLDVGVLGNRKHHVAGLLEADISDARRRIRQLNREGGKLSFQAWFIKTLADTLADHPRIHSIRKGRRKRYISGDVDISLPLEKTVGEESVPLPLIIRKASEKSISQICEEIGEAGKKRVASSKDYVLTRRKDSALTGFFFLLPGILRRLIWRLLLRSPRSLRRNMGTAMVTMTGISGGSGWIIPKSLHNLALALGPINRKPWIAGGKILPRDILPVTILFDHDVVDGAPSARFARDFIKRLEGCYQLDEKGD